MRRATAVVRASAMVAGDDAVAAELDASESLVRAIRRENASLASDEMVERVAAASCLTVAELAQLADAHDDEQSLLRSVADRAGVVGAIDEGGTLLERCWRLWDAEGERSRAQVAQPPARAAPLIAAFEAHTEAPRDGAIAPPVMPELPSLAEPMSLAAYALLTVEIERSGLAAALVRHGLSVKDLDDGVRAYWDSRLARDAAMADAFATLVDEARRDWFDF